MESSHTLLWFLIGGIVGWTIRSFVHVPTGQVLPMVAPGTFSSAPKVLRGRIVSCSTDPTSPAGVAPKAGFASAPLHHWCYQIAEGETAGDVAAAITGEEARYQELLLANPDVPKVGTPGKVGPEEWNFAPDSLAPGSQLSLPQTWNPWIDELGQPRGQKNAFPEDSRRGTGTHGAPMLTQGTVDSGRVYSYSPPVAA